MNTRPRLVAAVVSLAFFMLTLDGSIIVTALPQIGETFGANPVRLSIVVTAYLLAGAIFMPAASWLGDRFGARTVFQLATGIFIVGSILAGLSDSVTELAAARILQATGGALIMPIGRMVVLRAAAKADLVKAISTQTMISQLGPIIGPVVGGFITTYISWRWNFLINVPIGLVGIVVASLYIENHREAERRRLDWRGFLFVGSTFALLLYGLESVARPGANKAISIACILAGLALGAAGIRHLHRHTQPLVDLSLLRIRAFCANLDSGSLARIAFGAQTFLLPLLFQTIFGMSAFASGLLTFVGAIGALAINAFGPRMVGRWRYRTVLICNGVTTATGVFACAFFTPDTPIALIIVVLLIAGSGNSLQFTLLTTLAFSSMSTRQMGGGTTLTQLMQQLTRGFGVTVAALILNASLAWRDGVHFDAADFEVGFVGASVIALVATLLLIRLPADAGRDLRAASQPAGETP